MPAIDFHTLQDLQDSPFYAGATTLIDHRYIITQRRTLAYGFRLHQHPYVEALVRRLLRKGTRGLQAADTEYHTRIKLVWQTEAHNAYGKDVLLEQGDVIYLADGTTAILSGESVRFAGPAVLRLADSLRIWPQPDTFLSFARKVEVITNGEIVTLDPLTTFAHLVDGHPVPVLYSDLFSATDEKDTYAERPYKPNRNIVREPYPVKDLDFSFDGAYSVYNWELFYHVPIMIAIHLSKNERFAEAQRWFHFLFDPTDDSDGPTPERFWKVRPFQATDVRKAEEILANLAGGADETLRAETVRSIEAWKDAPFRPHVIARFRQQSYMYKTVMAYLDNLIAWGDSLFRQDTGEAIDEALQLYVLAANILGPKPLAVPKKGSIRTQTYANLRRDLKAFGTVLRDIEPDLPFDIMPLPTAGWASDGDARLATVRSLGKALYFCVPRNDKLLGYWSTVADRLFKIRNSLNFQGTFRQLALFEPPIDPALLARAVAAGLDVGAIVSGLNQPLPLVRFALVVQKAAEIALEVKALGGALLTAMEKEDNEAMTLLRAKHERGVMQLVERVRYGQQQEAIKAKEGLLLTLAGAVDRYAYYERQLGRTIEDVTNAIPALEELAADQWERMKLVLKEPELPRRSIAIDIAQDLGGAGGKIVNRHEAEELEKSRQAKDIQEVVKTGKLAAQGLRMLPDFGLDYLFWGVGGHTVIGGATLGEVASLAADVALAIGDRLSFEAGTAAKIGSYARREQDWAFQSNLAVGEINQILKQLRAAQIREAVAEQELKSHRLQMQQAEEIERFLNEEDTEKKGKTTNKSLYTWMKREVRGLYSQCLQFAFDVARRAERALQHELGDPSVSYLEFQYMAGKEGLLAGEKLFLDIKRMELAYHEQNRREYELTKHVSLLQVDPIALVTLRATGQCAVRLDESLFDFDGPGHYFRRIKTVAVSLPCVIGPYASVNCTVTLLKSEVRIRPAADDDYARLGAEDPRFSDYLGSVQSVVTSGGQNDAGLFETNLRDERYLPFENCGVIGDWRLELPANPTAGEPRQFDYDTISDVVLHIRYTARDGGDGLRRRAKDNLRRSIENGTAAGSVRLFSIRHEFPSEWAEFKSGAPEGEPDVTLPVTAEPGNAEIAAAGTPGELHPLVVTFRQEHYPYWSHPRGEAAASVSAIKVLARSKRAITVSTDPEVDGTTLARDGGVLSAALTELPPLAAATLTLYFDHAEVDDLWIAVTWKPGIASVNVV